MNKLLSLSLVASSLLFADSDFEQLKKQMDAQQLIIEKLKEKIQKLENNKTAKEGTSVPPIAFTTIKKEENTSLFQNINNKASSFSQKAFMPDISLVVDTSFVSRSRGNDEVSHLEVPGIAHGILGSHSDGEHTHATYNANNGFNLNYSEIVLSSNVDPYFRLDGVFHFSEHGVEIEEAYFTSTALDYGLRVKGGKFLSNFGYSNEQHHHVWDFNDMPLVYEAFLGNHGINELGLQVQWIAPTETYLMLGAEVLQGENEQMFGNATVGDVEDPIAKGTKAPSMFVAYAKSSVDIDNTTILGGLSFANGSSRIDHSSDENAHVFTGNSSLYGADFLVKHYFDSYSSLTWQNEVLVRDMDGTTHKLNEDGAVIASPNIRKKQAGLYSQIVYGVNQNWSVGARYDTIFKNDVYANDINQDEANNLNKYSAMLEYRTSEFARFRLQYNRNDALYNEDGNQQSIDTIMLQANIAVGAHGAHSF